MWLYRCLRMIQYLYGKKKSILGNIYPEIEMIIIIHFFSFPAQCYSTIFKYYILKFHLIDYKIHFYTFFAHS